MQSAIKQTVQDMIKNSKVIMFSKTFCPYCDTAKEVFNSAEVKFDVQELDTLPDGGKMQDALQEITGQRTVPNIFIGGTHVGGCSDLQAKIKNGSVFELFEKNDIQYKL